MLYRKAGNDIWMVVAFGAALFAGITVILAKCGIQKTDSNVATVIRTIVVLVFSWLMVFLTGSQLQIGRLVGEHGWFGFYRGLRLVRHGFAIKNFCKMALQVWWFLLTSSALW